jgi:hypothetical protein
VSSPGYQDDEVGPTGVTGTRWVAEMTPQDVSSNNVPGR